MAHGTPVLLSALALAAAAAASSAAAAEPAERAAWLRCHRGPEVDWPALRVKLDGYADKYLQAPQLFSEEARLALLYAHKPLALPGGAPCPLGDLALRLLMWLFVEEGVLSEALQGAGAFAESGGGNSLEPAAMLALLLRGLLAVPLAWPELLNAGWPLFSLLAQLSQRARAVLAAGLPGEGPCEEVKTWGGRPYLAALLGTFESGALLPAHASGAALLALDRDGCPLAVASAVLALADGARWDATDAGFPSEGGYNAPYYRHAAVAPLAAEGPRTMLADLDGAVGLEPRDDRSAAVAFAERSVQELRRRAGREWPLRLLTTPWPIWRLLDRLGCSEWVEVRTHPLAPTAATRRLRSALPSFFLHVFPHRVGSDGLQSSRTRALRQPYCAKEFQNELDGLRLRRGDRGQLRVLEAGPHLGDCLLWAASRVGCQGRLRMTGYDAVHQLAALMRKSIERNGMAACLDVKLAFLAEASGEPSGLAGVPSLHLDGELREHVDLLKVHTNGGEDAILRGGRMLFTEPGLGVDVVVVNSASPQVLLRCANFLLGLPVGPYELEVRGRALDPSNLEQELEEATRAGSAQLVAHRPGLPPPAAFVNATRRERSW